MYAEPYKNSINIYVALQCTITKYPIKKKINFLKKRN